jgi:hypothetical protein
MHGRETMPQIPQFQLGPPQTADQEHIQAVKVQRLDSFFFLFFISHESRMKNCSDDAA